MLIDPEDDVGLERRRESGWPNFRGPTIRAHTQCAQQTYDSLIRFSLIDLWTLAWRRKGWLLSMRSRSASTCEHRLPPKRAHLLHPRHFIPTTPPRASQFGPV